MLIAVNYTMKLLGSGLGAPLIYGCSGMNLKGGWILCPFSRIILVHLSLGPESSPRGIMGKEL